MRITAALLIFVSISVTTATILGFAYGIFLEDAILSLGLGLLAAIRTWIKTPVDATEQKISAGQIAAAVIYLIIMARLFLWITFRDGDALKGMNNHNFGDTTLHVTYIQFFANHAKFWPDNPILSGTKLHYPIGMDLFNSLLILCGADLARSLQYVGFIGAILTGVMLIRWGGAFTLLGFIFNGGMAAFPIFWESYRYLQWEIAWKSIPLAIFGTQRGFLFAVPAGLLLMTSWRNRLFPEKGRPAGASLPLTVEIILYGLLPIFHMHSFVFLSCLLGCWFIFAPPKLKKEVLKIGLGALIPATFLILHMTSFFSGFSIVHIKWGWLQENENFFRFWFYNFGLLPALWLALLVKLIRDLPLKGGIFCCLSSAEAAFVIPASFLFLIFTVVMMHPNDWDNIKMFVWCYLIILPYLYRSLMMSWPRWMRGMLAFSLFFSGSIDLYHELNWQNGGYELAKLSELTELSSALEDTPIDATFAAYWGPNHPLILSGRKVALGYPGHVWVHGFDFSNIQGDLEILLRGQGGWKDSARRLKVKYLFWGHIESEQFPSSKKPWIGQLPVYLSGSWGSIYDLSSLSGP